LVDMTRRAILSEGRGLRARIAMPCASRGITQPSGENERPVA